VVLGSPYVDEVIGADGEGDTISTFAGNDYVDTEQFIIAAPPEPDIIDLGPGDDHASVGQSFTSAMTVTGGDGEDDVYFMLPSTSGWVVDARRGQLRHGKSLEARFGGFETYAAAGHWRFVGGTAPDHVIGSVSELESVDLGGGDDVLEVRRLPGSGRTHFAFRGGSGHDQLIAWAYHSEPVSLDLHSGRLAIGRDASGRVVRFEDADVAGGLVSLVGTGRANSLMVHSCRVGSVRGLGGNDDLTVQKLRGYRSCQESVVRSAYGGAGNDTLHGGPERELLDGGRGHDSADGGPRHDTCVSIEVPTGCEG
jgi:Ca2+-binding RTX toxin-like protein